jgi:hypothetical protein
MPITISLMLSCSQLPLWAGNAEVAFCRMRDQDAAVANIG